MNSNIHSNRPHRRAPVMALVILAAYSMLVPLFITAITGYGGNEALPTRAYIIAFAIAGLSWVVALTSAGAQQGDPRASMPGFPWVEAIGSLIGITTTGAIFLHLLLVIDVGGPATLFGALLCLAAFLAWILWLGSWITAHRGHEQNVDREQPPVCAS